MLETIPKGKRLFIEIKCSDEALPILKNELLSASIRPDQITLIGFDLPLMTKAKKLLPEYEVCFIFDFEKDVLIQKWKPQAQEIISAACNAGVDGLDLLACDAVNEDLVKLARNAGLKIYVWTVNDPIEAKRFYDLKIDGITTNRPDWLKTKLMALLIKE